MKNRESKIPPGASTYLLALNNQAKQNRKPQKEPYKTILFVITNAGFVKLHSGKNCPIMTSHAKTNPSTIVSFNLIDSAFPPFILKGSGSLQKRSDSQNE